MDDPITRLWDKHIAKTVIYDMPERSRRRYVRRVELFIRAFPETRLQAISSEDLNIYLKGIGRKSDWQFRQIVDALRILFVDIVESSWSVGFYFSQNVKLRLICRWGRYQPI